MKAVDSITLSKKVVRQNFGKIMGVFKGCGRDDACGGVIRRNANRNYDPNDEFLMEEMSDIFYGCIISPCSFCGFLMEISLMKQSVCEENDWLYDDKFSVPANKEVSPWAG